MTTRRRLVFGQADPRAYRVPTPADLARGGTIAALCRPPEYGDRVPYFEAVEAIGSPCHRCIANEAAPGTPARCGFISRRTHGGIAPESAPIVEPSDPERLW